MKHPKNFNFSGTPPLPIPLPAKSFVSIVYRNAVDV